MSKSDNKKIREATTEAVTPLRKLWLLTAYVLLLFMGLGTIYLLNALELRWQGSRFNIVFAISALVLSVGLLAGVDRLLFPRKRQTDVENV